MTGILPSYQRFVNGVPVPSISRRSFRLREKYLIVSVLLTFGIVWLGALFYLPEFKSSSSVNDSVYNVYKRIQKAGPELLMPPPLAQNELGDFPVAAHHHGDAVDGEDPHVAEDRNRLRAKIEEDLGMKVLERPQFEVAPSVSSSKGTSKRPVDALEEPVAGNNAASKDVSPAGPKVEGSENQFAVAALGPNADPDIKQKLEVVKEVVAQYHAIAGMPLVIGSVDGTLIEIDAPRIREDQFVDRHGNHSINCMAVCGPTGIFYFVSARWPGSVHDSRVLKNSQLFTKMEAGWRPLPNCVLLGDSGYPLLNWLLTPTGVNLDAVEVARYNRAHKSTRRVIENAFGILKEKFPCLNYLRVNPTFAGEIFKCCTTLCNIARTVQDEQQILQEINHNGDVGNDDHVADRNLQGQRRLQEMLNYFRN